MNLYQKLAEIRKMATVVNKSKKGYGYTYAPEEEVLANVTAGMNKYNVSLVPRITEFDLIPYTFTKRKFGKDGTVLPDDIVNEMLIKGTIEYTWVNDEDPSETVVVPWALVGQQSDASQSAGSAMSYSMRYFLLKYFQSATTDGDVDAYRSKQKEKEESEERETAKAIVDAIHTMTNAFVDKNPDHREPIKSIIKKHVIVDGKGVPDYYKITRPDVAVGLKEAITKYIAENTPKVGVENKTGEIKDGISE